MTPISRRTFLMAVGSAPALQQRRQTTPNRPSSVADLPNLQISEAALLIRSKRLSPVELTSAVLRRIDDVEPKVHAFVTLVGEEATHDAATCEKEIMRGAYRGPLHGIPVGVKDTHYTKGIRTTAGSPVLADFIPTFDATVVAKLKAAGAVLIGKTTLPEFSFGGATPGTNNPWDVSRTPGGSSGGSGAALGARMLLGATGGDTSGSLRLPAAFCGVVGLKPTYGRVSRHGVTTISWSLDHVGPMARTVHDNALLMNVIAGHDPLDDTSVELPSPDYTKALGRGVRGMQVGIPSPGLFDGFHPDVMQAFQDALNVYRKLGAQIREVKMPPTLDVIDEVQLIVRIAEAASYHEQFVATRADRYGPTPVRSDIETGSMVTAVQYLKAQKVRAVFVKEMRELFKAFDVFVTPTMSQPAGAPEYTSAKRTLRHMFNVCGFPAIAIPAGFSKSPAGLPLSLQIAARPFEEERIYAAAFAYESETQWYRQRPQI